MKATLITDTGSEIIDMNTVLKISAVYQSVIIIIMKDLSNKTGIALIFDK